MAFFMVRLSYHGMDTFKETAKNIFVSSIKGDDHMAKRKAEFNAVEKYSKTPKKNIQETEFSAEFIRGEDPMKNANRNSNHGREGRK